MNTKTLTLTKPESARETASDEVKKLLKTVREYSLHIEKPAQTLLQNFEIEENFWGLFENDPPETLLNALFRDLFKKIIQLNETKEMLVNILKKQRIKRLLFPLKDPSFFSSLSAPDKFLMVYTDSLMPILIKLLDDDEWFMRFFTEYIHEILPLSKLRELMPALEFEDFERSIVAYLMWECTGNVKNF